MVQEKEKCYPNELPEQRRKQTSEKAWFFRTINAVEMSCTV